MVKSLKIFIILLAGLRCWGQSGIIPTVFYQILTNKIGVVTTGVTMIPPQYMIGQYTHTLSVILNNSGGTCVFNNLVVGLDGSFDNTNWQSLGVPITALTGTPGVTGQLTGFTTVFGAFPFIRMNVRRGWGTNCVSNVSYVGSTTPVSFGTSVPQLGEEYQNGWVNNSSVASSTFLAQSNGLGSRLNVYGVIIHNEDATTANVYTLQLFNKDATPCNATGATEEDLGTYRIPGQGTLALSFGGTVPVFQFPNSLSASLASSFDHYDAAAGFYTLCIIGSGAQLTTVNVVTRSF